MIRPSDLWEQIKQNMKSKWIVAFVSCFVMGLLIHMPIMLSDIPNHDGLDSLHFDQNMITSGRWFLTIACGFSSYYTLPWVIGLLALLFLSVAVVLLVEFLEVDNQSSIVLISGLLVAFPALASTFAYVFTMDGYMMALMLAIAAPLCVKKFRLGFIWGGVCLTFSMGIYQSYLPFAVLLSIYGILMLCMESGSVKEKILSGVKFLYMGIVGVGLYYIILQVLLKVQSKELATYQGIDGMGTVERAGLIDTIKKMYVDFVAFTLKGNILINNTWALIAFAALLIIVGIVFAQQIREKRWWKSPWPYILLLLLLIGLPVSSNLILVISPDVTYHLLMRYHWVLYPVILIGYVSRYGKKCPYLEWGLLLSAGVILFNFAITDNIAYSNLEKRYEKTYAYCVRLLDRIEQTEGYYQGIPIAMIGVVGDESYPVTDITGDVTGTMIGMNGDSLLYTGTNYKLFMESYLGATLNILPAESMAEMYYDEEYRAMDSFPGENSIRIIDGVMYIKTENKE